MPPFSISLLFAISSAKPILSTSNTYGEPPSLHFKVPPLSQIYNVDSLWVENEEQRQEDNSLQALLKRKKRYVLRNKRWRRNLLTWRLDKNNIKEEDEYIVRATLHRAFQEWSASSSVRFEEVFGNFADIVVAFERGRHQDAFPFDGKDGIVAHAFYPHDGRLHFDADEDWSLNSANGVNLYQTAVHEIGHLLGLEHSVDPRAVMFAARRPYNPDFALGDDDVRAIRVLFPSEEELRNEEERKPPHKKMRHRDREMTLSEVVENLHGEVSQEISKSNDLELTFPFPLPRIQHK